MWQQYIAKHPDEYKSSQFCEYYKRWDKKVNPLIFMTHKDGDKMFVDYAGKILEIIEPKTEEVQELQFLWFCRINQT